VLNGYAGVSKDMHEKVMAIANQMGYVPNAAAISLVKKKSAILGVIYEVSSGFSNLYFSAILEAFRLEAEANGYMLMLLSQSTEHQIEYWKHCLSHKITSVFIISTRDQSVVENELRNHGISVLTLDPIHQSANLIATDNAQAMNLSLSYLYHLGHRKIAFLQGSLTTYVGKARLDAYREFVKQHNLTPMVLLERDNPSYSLQEGYDTTMGLLKQFDAIDAMACCSDVLALGAIYALQDSGYVLPRDVSVMGFDDLRLCEIVRPKLSTVRQNSRLIGKTACETLLKMDDPTSVLKPIQVEASLVLRDSTAPKKP
jgi:LacI family transcriptional regulator